jgi:type II restriction enzyme
MKQLTASDLVNQIALLEIGQSYKYVSGRSALRIVEITKPEGPIIFENVEADGSSGRSGSISREQLARMAYYCSTRPNYPLHVDRIFSAGGNTRSAFETLLAYTPHFFICYPKRVDIYTGEVLTNLKHFMWCPDKEHPLGAWRTTEYEELVSEALDLGVEFGRITITEADLGTEFENIEAKTTHTQMQIALIEIGNALNFQTWIARNDRSIQVRDTTLGNLEGVIQSLEDVGIFFRRDMKEKAALIDSIWFAEDGSRIPAVLEIEHSTGVTSGLTRMSKLRETLGDITPTYTVVAPDQLRNKVVKEANDRLFRALKVRFMPYSTVRELYGLVKRYPLSGIVDTQFVRAFMEQIVQD